MKAEEIFNEVMKSAELPDILGIPKNELDQLHYNEPSPYKEIEIIKTIIRGEENKSDRSAIFNIIQNQIMQL